MKLGKHPQDEMTPVERRNAIKKGENVDRIPVDLLLVDNKSRLINTNVKKLYFDADKMIEAEVNVYKTYGLDWVECSPNSKAIAQSLGANYIFSENKSPQLGEPFLKDYKKLHEIEVKEVRQSDRLSLYYEVAERLAEKVYGIVNMHVFIGGPLTIAGYLRGIENILVDMRKNPEELHQLLRITLNAMKKVVDEFSTIDGVVFALADPLSSTDLISPKSFENFSYPYLKEIISYATEKTGEKPYIHICGKTEKIWKYLYESGIGTFSIDNKCSLADATKFFKGKVAITGNIPPVEVMTHGSKQDIKQSLEKCIESGFKISRDHTIGLGCDFPYGAPLENIDYLMSLIRENSIVK